MYLQIVEDARCTSASLAPRSEQHFCQKYHSTYTSANSNSTPTQAQPCGTQCRGCASNAPLAHPARRAEDARSASAGPGARSKCHFYRNTTSRLDPLPKAASGIVAAAASRPHSDERNPSRPQPRVQGRSPGQEGGEGVQRVEGERLTLPHILWPRPGGHTTMHIENTSRFV